METAITIISIALSLLFFALFCTAMIAVLFRTEVKNILASRKLASSEFSCSQCGKCCGFTVVVGDFDIHQLEESGQDLSHCVTSKAGVKYLTKTVGECYFVRGGKEYSCSKECSIYNDRLYICQRFPHLKYAGIKAIDTRCPEVQRMLKARV